MSNLFIPQRLLAQAPGWILNTDVIVVGSGIAGLTAAINARAAGHRVVLVTKAAVEEGSTRWAQGGIAAALSPEDSPAEHSHDTLVAGAGLCDPEAVMVLVTEGPAAVRRLIALGAEFDRDSSGKIALTREGGHHRSRIAHAGGDATGVEISRALNAAVALDEGIEIIEHALVLDLLLDEIRAVQGVTLHVMGEGMRDGVGAVLAPAVVLATGGIGQVFSQTTNPRVATGDGIAAAVRAGAHVTDLEFVQFHPTVMYLGPQSQGQQPLVSEAVRGEGAVLVDDDGKRFMQGVHELADLAPRDVVAKAIMRHMRQTGKPHVWLDGRGLDWEHRFPSIYASCLAHGINPINELIPVAPAQHYHSGGIHTDLFGRSSIPGLFACGEVACTGVHGANRLASNSLLEGLVFAERIGKVLASGVGLRRDPVSMDASTNGWLLSNDQRSHLQQVMTEGVGVLRSQASLTQAIDELDAMKDRADSPATESWEASNLWTVGRLLAHSARIRTETRGSHWREDHPDRDDEHWRVRIVSHVGQSGQVETTTLPVQGALE